MITKTLNLQSANDDFDKMCHGLVAHAGQELQAGETERIRGAIEALYWFNRSAYYALNRVYAVHIANIMSSQPAEGA